MVIYIYIYLYVYIHTPLIVLLNRIHVYMRLFTFAGRGENMYLSIVLTDVMDQTNNQQPYHGFIKSGASNSNIHTVVL
jgi:hypothetical protein